MTRVRFFFVRLTFIQSPVVLMLAGNRLCGYWCLFLVKFDANVSLCNTQQAFLQRDRRIMYDITQSACGPTNPHPANQRDFRGGEAVAMQQNRRRGLAVSAEIWRHGNLRFKTSIPSKRKATTL
jgi:hypothetical protein